MSRGFALLSQPIDSLYDTVLKSCNDLDVSSLNADKNNYKIGGKKRARFVINMLEMTSGTLLEAIHYKKYDLDTFLIPLFKNLAKYIPLEWGFRVHQLDLTSDGKLLEESKLSYKGYQFHQLEILYDGTRIHSNLEKWYKENVLDMPMYTYKLIGQEYFVNKDLEKTNFDIDIIEDGGIKQLHSFNKLYVVKEKSNQRSGLQFAHDNNVLYKIEIDDIVVVNARSVEKKGIVRKVNDLIVEIIFHANQAMHESIIINTEDKYVRQLILRIAALKDEETGRRDLVWPSEASKKVTPNLCSICTKNKFDIKLSTGLLCRPCFEEKFGKILINENYGEYYGGHKVALAGGFFGEYESGKMFLTGSEFIFVKENKNPAKIWEITIPLKSVIMDKWDIKEESRRQNITGIATNWGGGVGIGTGAIHDSGQRNRLIIPYLDENGIMHEPIFGVSSFRGKQIRLWAAELYSALVEVNKENTPKEDQDISKQKNTEDTKEHPLQILKLRLAKGEISKEEFEDLRTIIDT